jgi:hypothetical protein
MKRGAGLERTVRGQIADTFCPLAWDVRDVTRFVPLRRDEPCGEANAPICDEIQCRRGASTVASVSGVPSMRTRCGKRGPS